MGTAPEQIGPSRRVNPALLVVLAIVAVVAVGVLVFQLFSGGPEETPSVSPPRTTTPTTPAPRTTATASPPPETFEVFESKDPFRPLVVAGGGGGAAAGTTTGTTGTATGTTTGTTSVGAAGASAPTGGQRVSVLDVFDDQGTTKVQVKVGGTVYTVTAGQTFASNYKLVSVSGSCATLLRGDDKFTLCEGEEVIK
ncbi:MAG: hypothetical protein ACRDJ4_14320 [Actinomycetota bacterium]